MSPFILDKLNSAVMSLCESHDRLTRERDEARAREAALRAALEDLEATCASVASWSDDCVDYSHPARERARALLKETP